MAPFSYLLLFSLATSSGSELRYGRWMAVTALDDRMADVGVIADVKVMSRVTCASFCDRQISLSFTVVKGERGNMRCTCYMLQLSSNSQLTWPVTGASTFSFVITGSAHNVSEGKPARQSSDKLIRSQNSYAYASRAVDGDHSWDFVFASCSHTLGERAAWWQVDLSATYAVISLVITNRGDGFSYRLHDFTIHVYREDPYVNNMTSGAACHHHNGTLSTVTQTVICDAPLTGQVVRLTNTPYVNEQLHLCEVDVIAFALN